MLERERESSSRVSPGEIGIGRSEIGRLLKTLEGNGYIEPVTREEDPEGWNTLKKWGELEEEVPLRKVTDFFGERLTEEGRKSLQKAAERGNLDLKTPPDFLSALNAVVTVVEDVEPTDVEPTKVSGEPDVRSELEKVREKLRWLIPSRPTTIEEGEPIDRKLGEALKRGPSSLITDSVIRQLVMATTVGKVPLKAWLLNPRAAAGVLRAIAEEATSRAKIKTAIGETTKWLAEVAGDDSKRDALLNYIENLEETLGPYIEPFCQERGLPIPEKDTLARMALLLRINAEMRALQAQGGEIARQGEKLIKEGVKIQAETARNRMRAKELPPAIEAAKEVNAAREAEIAEKARNFLASLAAILSGATVGAIGGLYAGIESSVSTLVERHPKVAISLGAGLGVFTIQVVSYSGLGLPSGELLQVFALKSALVAGITAVGVGIGSGLVARLSRREEEQIPSQEELWQQ